MNAGLSTDEQLHQLFLAGAKLPRAGVPAGAVQNAENLFYDLQLGERGFLVAMAAKTAGEVQYPGPSFHLSGTPATVTRAAEFGEHNAYVFGRHPGLSEAELAVLAERRVLF